MTNSEATEAVLAGKRLSKPERCPEAIFSIMQKCWEERTKERPTMLEIYENLKGFQAKEEVAIANNAKPEPFYTLEEEKPNTFYKV